MNGLILSIGFFIKVWFSNDYLYIQPNNKYVWVEYNETRQSLKAKEILKIQNSNVVITIGIN